MDEQELPPDFKEFLKLLIKADVRYLLIGGYAVGYHGYPRTTADIDIFVAISPENANKLVSVFSLFGMKDKAITPELFLQPGKIIRMGLPPMRIEILSEIDGVSFDECFAEKIIDKIDNIMLNIISKKHLCINKKASARHKDIDDLQHLLDETI